MPHSATECHIWGDFAYHTLQVVFEVESGVSLCRQDVDGVLDGKGVLFKTSDGLPAGWRLLMNERLAMPVSFWQQT